jgi:TusA-related sulfurtransferase
MKIYLENIVCESYVRREGCDESRQTCPLTFGKILDRRMRELEPGSFIEIVILDAS